MSQSKGDENSLKCQRRSKLKDTIDEVSAKYKLKCVEMNKKVNEVT